MAAEPKGVAGKRDSLPAQQAAADPLQTYCPDLDQWPRSWAYEAGDIPPGLQIVECFTPFLRELLSRRLSRQTLRQNRDNIWALGGGVISQLQMDSDLRRRRTHITYTPATSPTPPHPSSHLPTLPLSSAS